MGSPIAKKMNFGGESCEITILSRSIQEAHKLRYVKNQVLLFLASWETKLSDLMVYVVLLSRHKIDVKEDIIL